MIITDEVKNWTSCCLNWLLERLHVHWHPCSTKWFSCHHHKICRYVVTLWNKNVFQTGFMKGVLKNIVCFMYFRVRGKLAVLVVKCWRMMCWHLWTGICFTHALNCHFYVHLCVISFDALEERNPRSWTWRRSRYRRKRPIYFTKWGGKSC
jgi:hypothetical protein